MSYFINTSEDKNSSEDKTHSKTKLVRRQNVLTNTMLKPRTIITPHIVQIKSHAQYLILVIEMTNSNEFITVYNIANYIYMYLLPFIQYICNPLYCIHVVI